MRVARRPEAPLFEPFDGTQRFTAQLTVVIPEGGDSRAHSPYVGSPQPVWAELEIRVGFWSHRMRRIDVVRRSWRRVAEPIPLWPWGVALSLAFFAVYGLALTVGASAWIERRVEHAVGQNLIRTGDRWVEISVDGQDVYLRGTAKTSTDARRAVAVAQDALGLTWAGRLDATRRVVPEFSEPTAKPARSEPPRPVQTVFRELNFRRAGGTLTLQGVLSDSLARDRIGAQARSLIGSGDPPLDRIENDLSVDPRVRAKATIAARRALEVLGLCFDGRIEVRDGVFVILCVAREADVPRVEALAQTPLEGFRIDTLEVDAVEEVVACDDRLSDVLSKSVVEFATASAEIRPTAFPIIDRVAKAARDCPGTLRVEGHTDARGQQDRNQRLSEARARSILEALVERELSRDRLDAVGYGESRPIDSNSTEAGRQKNRRIEIRVVRN